MITFDSNKIQAIKIARHNMLQKTSTNTKFCKGCPMTPTTQNHPRTHPRFQRSYNLASRQLCCRRGIKYRGNYIWVAIETLKHRFKNDISHIRMGLSHITPAGDNNQLFYLFRIENSHSMKSIPIYNICLGQSEPCHTIIKYKQVLCQASSQRISSTG